MTQALRGVQSVMGKLQGGLAKNVRSAFAGIGSGLGEIHKGLSAASSGISGVVAGLGGAVVVGLAAAGAKFALSAIAMKENAMIAFETILKSKDAAKRVMANAIAFAGATPFDTEGVIADYQRLLVAGFSEAEVGVVLAGAGDLGAAFGT